MKLITDHYFSKVCYNEKNYSTLFNKVCYNENYYSTLFNKVCYNEIIIAHFRTKCAIMMLQIKNPKLTTPWLSIREISHFCQRMILTHYFHLWGLVSIPPARCNSQT
jgi:hypothetical protein